MQTQYMVFPTKGPVTRGEVDWPDDPGFQRIADFVAPLIGCGRGHVERVNVFDVVRQEHLDMFVDDNGAIKGLPGNRVASWIYRTNVMVNDPRPDAFDKLPLIFGTAILFLRRVWF